METLATWLLLYCLDTIWLKPKEQIEYYPPTLELIEVDQRPLLQTQKQFI